MPDAEDLRLDPARGVRLSLDDYTSDFAERESAVYDHVSWKFERRQHFEERGDPSRDALTEGRWDEALRLLAEEHDDWLAYARRDRERNAPFRRVRVVEQPLTPYMQWELHALRVQARAGMAVRVVEVERVRALESAGRLPEVVVLGGQVLYEVLYTDDGELAGGRRFLDAEPVRRWARFVEGLYAQGEDVVAYVDRCVARLPPPFSGQHRERV